MAWDCTHGKTAGAYMKAGRHQLYVKRREDGAWSLYVDGQLEGCADGEAIARAAAELAIRCVVPAGVAGEAAAA